MKNVFTAMVFGCVLAAAPVAMFAQDKMDSKKMEDGKMSHDKMATKKDSPKPQKMDSKKAAPSDSKMDHSDTGKK